MTVKQAWDVVQKNPPPEGTMVRPATKEMTNPVVEFFDSHMEFQVPLVPNTKTAEDLNTFHGGNCYWLGRLPDNEKLVLSWDGPVGDNYAAETILHKSVLAGTQFNTRGYTRYTQFIADFPEVEGGTPVSQVIKVQSRIQRRLMAHGNVLLTPEAEDVFSTVVPQGVLAAGMIGDTIVIICTWNLTTDRIYYVKYQDYIENGFVSAWNLAGSISYPAKTNFTYLARQHRMSFKSTGLEFIGLVSRIDLTEFTARAEVTDIVRGTLNRVDDIVSVSSVTFEEKLKETTLDRQFIDVFNSVPLEFPPLGFGTSVTSSRDASLTGTIHEKIIALGYDYLDQEQIIELEEGIYTSTATGSSAFTKDPLGGLNGSGTFSSADDKKVDVKLNGTTLFTNSEVGTGLTTASDVSDTTNGFISSDWDAQASSDVELNKIIYANFISDVIVYVEEIQHSDSQTIVGGFDAGTGLNGSRQNISNNSNTATLKSLEQGNPVIDYEIGTESTSSDNTVSVSLSVTEFRVENLTWSPTATTTFEGVFDDSTNAYEPQAYTFYGVVDKFDNLIGQFTVDGFIIEIGSTYETKTFLPGAFTLTTLLGVPSAERMSITGDVPADTFVQFETDNNGGLIHPVKNNRLFRI